MHFLTNIWWVKLPRLFRRLAVTPTLALTDGLYVTAAPPVAAFLSPFVFTVGLFFGWGHLLLHQLSRFPQGSFIYTVLEFFKVGDNFELEPISLSYEYVFSESFPFLLVVIFLGVANGHLGAMFLIGFVLGDLLLNPAWMFDGDAPTQLAYFFSRVIEYGLLGILVVQIPLVTKALLVQCYEVMRFGKVVSLVLATLGHSVLSGVLVFFWAQTVPFLLRPVFVWNQVSLPKNPPVKAAWFLQSRLVWVLVAVAVLASIARMVAQITIAGSDVHSKRIGAIEDAITEGEFTPLTERLPRILTGLFAALWGALLLGGLYAGWTEGVVVAIVLMVLNLIRLRFIPLPFGAWSRWMNKVPLLVRLMVHIGVTWGVYVLFVPADANFNSSFKPLLVLILFAIVLLFLLNPGLPENQDEAKHPSTA